MGASDSKSELYENSLGLFSESEKKNMADIFAQICGSRQGMKLTFSEFQVCDSQCIDHPLLE